MTTVHWRPSYGLSWNAARSWLLGGLVWALVIVSCRACLSEDFAEESGLDVVSFRVRQELRTRDLLDYSNRLTEGLDGAEGQGPLTALNVFLRTGQTERISAAIRQIPVGSIIPIDAHDVPKQLLKLKYFAQLREWLDRFPSGIGGFQYAELESFLAEWERKQGKAQLESWLATKAELKLSVGRNRTLWPSPWADIYHTYLARQGKLRPHLDAAAEMVRRDPVDWEALLTYLAIWNRLPGEKPALDWLGETVAPKHALDAFVLARTLGDSRYKQPGSAARILERSLTLPITEYDRENMNLVGLTSMYVHADMVEQLLRTWTKTELAEIYLKLGNSQRAQEIIEDLTGKPDGTLADLAPYRLAGQTQAMSGQRGVEERIVDAEQDRKDSDVYWIGRAEYYVGRGELDEAEGAYAKAIAIEPDARCVRDLGLLLIKRDKHAKAEQVYRAAQSRSPADDFWLWQLQNLIGKPGVEFDWDAPLNWDYSAHWIEKGRFGQQPQLLMDRVRTRAIKKGERVRFWRMVEELGGEDPPVELVYTIGVFHDREGRSDKAIEFLTRAWNNWQDDAYPAPYRFGEELVRWHLAHRDWRGGEKVLRRAGQIRYFSEPKEWDHWAELSVQAAQEGEHREAVRLWRERCRLTLHADGRLEQLASLGVRGELLAFYTDLQARAPDSRAVESARERLARK